MKTVAWIVGFVIVLGMIFGDSESEPGRSSPSTESRATDTPDDSDVSDDGGVPRVRKGAGAGDNQGRDKTRRPRGGGEATGGSVDPSAAEQATSHGRTFLVSRVIDGDTLELANGETVRLVGIDTPEQGVCGSLKASVNLARLTLGQRVRLAPSDEDRDRYGRLLRYVDIGDMDTGLRLIKNGFAIARYDSRDGYGFHPREPRYLAADAASKNYTCPKPTAPVPFVGGSCAPGYTPCIRLS